MKPLLIFLFIPLLGTSQVYKFKAYATKVATFNGKEYVNNEVSKVNILVVVNLDKQKIKTFGKSEGDYDLIKLQEQETQDDGSVMTTYEAVDNDGTKCLIKFNIYSDLRKRQNTEDAGIANLGICIGDALLLFYLRKDD